MRLKRLRKKLKRGNRLFYPQVQIALAHRSALIEFLFSKWKGKDLSKLNYDTQRWVISIPETFSFLDDPESAIDTIYSLVCVARKTRHLGVHFDHSKCTVMDIAASAILDVVAMEIRREWRTARFTNRMLSGDYPHNENVAKVIKCMGITKNLKVRGSKLPQEVEDEFVKFDLYAGHKKTEGFANTLNDQEIAASRLARYVDECLKRGARVRLSTEGQRRILKWAGEIITNAEEHSGLASWYAIGYMVPLDHGENQPFLGECQLAIFNFGWSMHESLKDRRAPDETHRSIQRLVNLHTEKNFFGPSNRFQPEDLWTLYALQDGVSRFSERPGGSDRGRGTVEMIEAFQYLGRTKSGEQKPQMSLVSGGTRILFDGKYPMKPMDVDGGQRMVIAFNEANTLEERPDSRNVHSLSGNFPGTLLTFRFFIDRTYLTELSKPTKQQ